MICLVLYFFSEGISALVEIPRDCVVAAVGKELSEYMCIFSLCLCTHTCLYSYMNKHIWVC